jgi:hypothetical protein
MLRLLMSWCVPARALRFQMIRGDGPAPADLAVIKQTA